MKEKIMIVGLHFLQACGGMVRPVMLNLVLPVTFFLSETDNSVTRFYFIIPFINYTMFLIFF